MRIALSISQVSRIQGGRAFKTRKGQYSQRLIHRLGSSPPLSALSVRSLSSGATEETDVLIVGGGVVGCAIARLLNQRMPSLQVGLVEAGQGPPPLDADSLPHPRSYALSPASLELLGLTPESSSRLGYYQRMQIWEAHQPATLMFTEKDLASDHLGAVVEDGVLTNYLWKEIDCRIYKNTTVSDIQLPSHASAGLVKLQLQSTAKDDDKAAPRHHQTKLLVAADGANSSVRRQLGISTVGLEYGQAALTFTVELTQPHNGRAFQRFLETGPIALLPTFSPNHAIVVWSTPPNQVQAWKDQEGLVEYVNSLLQEGPGRLKPIFQRDNESSSIFSNILYGIDKVVDLVQYGPAMAAQEYHGPFLPPPLITKTVSPQFSFPLSCKQVTSYTNHRLALTGDAAHTVHPMAGQGLNLGLQDVANLVDVVQKAVDSGMDVATFLDEYESSRKSQVSLTMSGIHALHQMFGVQDNLAKHAKSLGMNLIQNVGPVRRSLVHAACQGVALSK